MEHCIYKDTLRDFKIILAYFKITINLVKKLFSAYCIILTKNLTVDATDKLYIYTTIHSLYRYTLLYKTTSFPLKFSFIAIYLHTIILSQIPVPYTFYNI